MYKAGIFKSVAFKCPVISVGNLTMGGSGKTPFCIYLAKLLEDKGKKTAIVLRGYKRKSKGAILVKKEHTAEEVGEEAIIYKRHLESPIVVAEKREEALKVFEEPLDVIILDDGFQHLRVKREIDIVLVDGSNLKDLLPYPLGRLREPLSSLKNASLIAFTKSDEEKVPQKLEKYVGKIPTIYVDFDWDETLLPFNIPLSDLTQKRVLLLLGIGNPQFFVKQAENKNINIVEKIILKDHAYPNEKNSKKVLELFEDKKCDYILTTEKDYIKWFEVNEIAQKLLYPQIVLKLKDREKNFEKIFSDILK
jgi:tetraacyldisaccharide 4'-kinase